MYAPEVFSTYMKNPKKFSKNIAEYLIPFFCLSLFFCFLLGLFSQEIIFLFTTPAYHNAFPIITILNMLYATYFFGKQRQLLLVKNNIDFRSFISYDSIEYFNKLSFNQFFWSHWCCLGDIFFGFYYNFNFILFCAEICKN